MKIREVHIHHFRSFVGEAPPVKFYDEATDLVRPLSVLVGSNGSGKSTVFEVIEGLLSYALDIVEDTPVTRDVREEGYAAVAVELGSEAPETLQRGLRIALGRKDRAPAWYRGGQICHLEQRGGKGRPYVQNQGRAELNQWVGSMTRGDAELRDGLLLFPHNRWIEHEQRGAIEPPPRYKPWMFRFEPASNSWQGSLSQLWVWQNYLDLEQRRAGRENLLPFVEPIEKILGRGQRVLIKEGHVRIERPWGPSVEPHQLPSGEQQILALFGEIIRRLRPGAVVLIDEIELSLHPALQRAVLFHLRELARDHDLQIVITTHSMEIVNAVSPSEIINLDDMVTLERGETRVEPT